MNNELILSQTAAQLLVSQRKLNVLVSQEGTMHRKLFIPGRSRRGMLLQLIGNLDSTSYNYKTNNGHWTL